MWNVVTVWFAALEVVIVLAWFLWRQRHVIKVDPRCTSEVWFHGIGRGSSDWILSKATSSFFFNKMIVKLERIRRARPKHKDQTQHPLPPPPTNTLLNGSNNKQWINNNIITTLERTAAKATMGLKCILLAKSSP